MGITPGDDISPLEGILPGVHSPNFITAGLVAVSIFDGDDGDDLSVLHANDYDCFDDMPDRAHAYEFLHPIEKSTHQITNDVLRMDIAESLANQIDEYRPVENFEAPLTNDELRNDIADKNVVKTLKNAFQLVRRVFRKFLGGGTTRSSGFSLIIVLCMLMLVFPVYVTSSSVTPVTPHFDFSYIQATDGEVDNMQALSAMPVLQAITLIDSGASAHIWSALYMFVIGTIRACQVKVKIAKGIVMVTKMGTVCLTSKGKTVYLQDTLYLEGANHNLISVSCFDRVGYTIVINSGVKKVYPPGTQDPILIAEEKGGVYVCAVESLPVTHTVTSATIQQADSPTHHAHVVEIAHPARTHTTGLSTFSLWHNRMGHTTDEYVRIVAKKCGKPIPHGQQRCFCDTCVAANFKKQQYHKTRVGPAVTHKLQRVSTDQCHMGQKSRQGSYYMSVIHDDHTRFLWTLFQPHKDYFADQFKNWLVARKTQDGKLPEEVRSDGGGEIDNNYLRAHFASLGIKFTTTTTGSSNQNPFAERSIRSVNEVMRAIMHYAGMPLMFWEDAAEYAAYILNRLPRRVLEGRTPLQMWRGETDINQHDYRYLFIFGSLTYTRIIDATGKISARSYPCSYLGVDTVRSGAKLWCLELEKVVRPSRDISVNEIHRPFRGCGGSPSKWSIPDHSHAPMHAPITPHNNITAHTTSTPANMPTPAERKQPVADAERRSARGWRPSSQSLQNLALVAEVETVELAMSSIERASKQLKGVEECARETMREVQAHHATAYHNIPIPRNYKVAVVGPYSKQWLGAVQRELDALLSLNTFEIVPMRPGIKCIPGMWLFSLKLGKDNMVKMFKARLVALGNLQVKGRDFTETFAAVAQMKSFRIILALSTIYNLPIVQMDVCNAYLNGVLEEEVYMFFPPGFPGKKDGFCLKLLKSIYGLRQAGRVFGNFLRKVLEHIGFKSLKTDTCIYVHTKVQSFLGTHVDDIILACDNTPFVTDVQNRLQKNMKIKLLGELEVFIGLEIERTHNTTFLHQQAYSQRIIRKFNMEQCKAEPTPAASDRTLSTMDCPKDNDEKRMMETVPYRSAVGSLLYDCLGTRPDMSQAVIAAAQFGSQPGPKHWQAVKRILRYLRGTTGHGILYVRTTQVIIKALTDSDWAGDLDTRKSTTGCVIYMAGAPIIWVSRLQKSQALSSCEAEFMALADTMTELLWLVQFLLELGVKHNTPIPIYIDNQAAMRLAHDPVQHQRSKHIDIRYMFIREYVAKGVFALIYVPTKQNIADLFTKATTFDVFRTLVGKLVQPKPN
jgi:hypothetical protein